MKRIKLLTHKSKNNDEKILGCFTDDIIPEIIDYYNSLPGFSLSKDNYYFADELLCDPDYVYLLQIWNKYNDDIIFMSKMFASETEAINKKNEYFKTHNNESLDFVIEKYTVNKKEWAEGFDSYC